MRIKIEEYHWDTFLGIWKKRFESNWIEIEEGRLNSFWKQFESTNKDSMFPSREPRFELVKQKDYQEELEAVYE